MDDYGNEIIEPQTEIGKKLAKATEIMLALETALKDTTNILDIIHIHAVQSEIAEERICDNRVLLKSIDKYRKRYKL